jgi:diguanylate cyclase (GGDEF)-like protein/PAS domain S-box-containing protein
MAAVIVFSVFTSSTLGNETEREYVSLINDAAQKQAANVSLYIKAAESGFSAITANIENIGDGGDLEPFIKTVASRSDVVGVVITDGGGNVKLSAGGEFDVQAALENESGKAYVHTSAEKFPTADFVVTVKEEIGENILIVIYSGDGVKSFANAASLPHNGRIVLVDPNKNVVDEGMMMGELSSLSRTAIDKAAEYGEIVKAVDSSASREFSVGGHKRAAGYSKITVDGDDAGWEVVTVGDVSEARRAASKATGIITVLTVIICVAGVVLTVITVSAFTKPLNVISRTIMQIRRGDHDARINVMSKNEYGEIARLFNDLIDDIVVSESRYRTIIEMSDNIIFEWNLKNNEVAFSNNFNKRFSYRAPSEHFGDSFLLKCKVHPDDAPRYRSDLEKLGKGGDFKRNEYRIKNIYGDYTWVLIRTASIKDANGEIQKIVGVMVDIDRAKKSEEILTTRASYDALTGVYNRDSVESLIENEIDLIAARHDQFAVLFVDIDDFKDYNDNYSHATGDQVLKFTAGTLQNIVQGFGIVGRYGGDEFVVCVKNCEANDPARIAEEILERLKEGYASDTGERITMDASIGVTVVSDASKRIEEIIGAADDAMYKIKKGGKRNYGFIEN